MRTKTNVGSICFCVACILCFAATSCADNIDIKTLTDGGASGTELSILVGSPEPQPLPTDHENAPYDSSTLSVCSDRAQYSIGENADILIHAKNTATSGQPIPICRLYVNMDFWDGNSWVRMTHQGLVVRYGDFVSWAEAYPRLAPGESVDFNISLADLSPQVTPGTYRAVIYVGYEYQNEAYQKIYAEFELTE